MRILWTCRTLRAGASALIGCAVAAWLACGPGTSLAQAQTQPAAGVASAYDPAQPPLRAAQLPAAQLPAAQLRAQRFLAGRSGKNNPAAALVQARREHLQLLQAQMPGDRTEAQGAAAPRLNPLSVPWTPVGPAQVASQRFGSVSGRVTAVAIDPADTTGNTVYLGTTGGGVWKSTNAAGPAAAVVFTPLTDVLPVFSANSGTAAIPSLSIGAVSVSPAGGPRVVLAGTGDPNDATDSYYGEGVLRSADGGVTWTLAQQSQDDITGHHSFVGLGIAGFAWSTASQGLVVMAVSQAAEGILVNAPDATNSVMGLYYSNDGGVTWQMGLIEDGSQVVQRPEPVGGNAGGNAATAVVWNATRQRFYAAVRFHGYYESADGVTWTRLAHQPGAGLTAAACPTNPGGLGNPHCPIFRGALAVQPATGDTFALTVDSSLLDQGLWQDVCTANGGGCATSPIAFGTQLPSARLEVGQGQANGSTAIAQGDYNLALAAVPATATAGSDTLLLVGTEDLYRCTLAGGCTLRNTTNAENGCAAPAQVSPAQHAIAALAGAGTAGTPLVYTGNDGGLWRSVDGVNQQQTPCSPDDAAHFQNLNPALGSLAEVVSFAEHPTDAATLLVGLGANGTASTGGTGSGLAVPWAQVASGEGGDVAIDPANPQNQYLSTEAGVSLRWCAKGNACAASDFTGTPTIGYAQVDNDASLIAPPLLLDPAAASDVLIGTCRVWRGPAQSGASWPGGNAISKMFGSLQTGACSATGNAFLRSLAAGGAASGAAAAQNAGSTVLYGGLAGSLDGGASLGGHVFANYAAGTASGSTAWTDLAQSPVTNDTIDGELFNPGGFDISSVVADPHDATGKTVYVTVMGFAGNGVNAPHVYRSVDGGTHWTNISSNLPGAPANALLVDPNDANTLYVALDTGLYVTTTVTSCTSGNCWSIYGTGLPNAPVVALAASAGLAVGDGRFGELRAATYGRGIWEIPLLTAAYPAAPLLTLSPTSLTFATQAVGTASASAPVTVTNTGDAPLNVTSIVTSGDFSAAGACVGAPIPAGGGCTVQVQFLPTATGTRTGVLTVYANVAGGQGTVALTGTGTPPAAILLNPVAVSFTTTSVGATSAVQNVTLSNTGGVPAILGTPAVTGDYAIAADTCGTTLAAGTGCTVSIVFRPTASGTRTGTLTVTDSVGTQTATLTGVGTLAATDALAPLALVFPQQPLNTASATQAVTLTNAGDVALTLIAAQISSGDFTVVNGCGNSLNSHASCTLLVAFAPKSVGAGTGVLTVSDQYRSQTVALSGVGVAPAGVSLSPVGTLSFAATGVGLSAPGQTMTLTNNGGLPLTIQSLSISGDYAFAAGSNTCGPALAAGSTCTAQIVFTPTAAGARAGTLTLVDNAAGSPQSLFLTGVGVDFTLAANGSTSATIAAGAQAVFPLLLTSQSGLSGTVAMACTGAPAHSTCLVNPATPGLGGTTTIAVTVATDTAALQWPTGIGATPIVQLAGCIVFGLLALGGRRRLRGLAMLACLLLAAGCGASRLIPSTSQQGGGGIVNPTPSGTYNLTVTGTSAGLDRTVGLTLIVQ